MIGNILLYTLTPQIKPRVNNILSSSFGFLASFMAMAYRGVRLIPENHPYLQANMTGKYGVMDVLREASKNLKFSMGHIDQLIVFFSLLAGMVILAIQFVLLMAALMVGTASAGSLPANIGEFFVTSNRGEDIALRMLDKVFGVPDIFGTNELTATTQPFHTALHQLFQFYSIGLLVIAALLIAYYIFAVIAETAQTGTPFGKRYNHVWAPIRLVVAIGLLIPIGTGLNSAQWITLYAAKFGSGFATNAWIEFNNTLNETLLNGDELVAEPNAPSMSDTVGFMFLVQACKQAYIENSPNIGNNIEAYIIDPNNNGWPRQDITDLSVTPPWSIPHINGMEEIHIVFGVHNPIYTRVPGNVFPFCGEMVVQNNVPAETPTVAPNGNIRTGAAQTITWRHFFIVARMWEEGDRYADPLIDAASEMISSRMRSEVVSDPDDNFKNERTAEANEFIAEGITNAATQLRNEYVQDPRIAQYGWGGAGIWYNNIANANGLLTSAAMNKASVARFPSVMEYTCEENRQQNEDTSITECYNPRMSRGTQVNYADEKDLAIATYLSDVYEFWNADPEFVTGNIVIDTINMLVGTQGLFDMCRNADVHPLAQISAAGKGLVDASIRNFIIGFGGGLLGSFVPYFGPALQAASGFFISIASVAILIGFILYYIVPFMPFLYFLFAVGGWVKGLFEAMVGVPLWALAHIRIDGQGLAGDAALNGYFLIFEIFIRPILIIFGLLASIIIFAAMIKVLNETFSIVVSNLSGFSSANSSQCGTAFDAAAGAPTGAMDYLRGPVDEFFFTVVYAILVYMIGMACFKLIDLIPNQILRWMGAGVSTFNDNAGEPAEGLVSKLAIGGGIMGGQMQQAGQQAASAGSNFLGAAKGFIAGR